MSYRLQPVRVVLCLIVVSILCGCSGLPELTEDMSPAERLAVISSGESPAPTFALEQAEEVLEKLHKRYPKDSIEAIAARLESETRQLFVQRSVDSNRPIAFAEGLLVYVNTTPAGKDTTHFFQGASLYAFQVKGRDLVNLPAPQKPRRL